MGGALGGAGGGGVFCATNWLEKATPIPVTAAMKSPAPTMNPAVVAVCDATVAAPPTAAAVSPTRDCFSNASPFSPFSPFSRLPLARETFQLLSRPVGVAGVAKAASSSPTATERYPDHVGD